MHNYLCKNIIKTRFFFLGTKSRFFYTHENVTGKIASHTPNNNAIKENFYKNSGINYL